jgi:hypothetical protein
VDYWKDLDLFKEIAERAVDKVDQKTRRTLKPFRFGKYILALGCNYFVIPMLFWATLSFFLTLAVYTDSWHTRIVALLACGVALYLSTKVFHFVIEGRQAVIYKIQASEWPRKLSTVILPTVYAALAYQTTEWAWPQGAALYTCHQGIQARLYTTEFWSQLAQCEPMKFILSGTGLLVVSYGLCVYLYFKFQNHKPESIMSYQDYIEAAKRRKMAAGGSGPRAVNPTAGGIAGEAAA